MDSQGYAAVLDDHGRRLAAAAGDDLALTIPSCPGWTMADLVWHVGVVQAFWTGLVAGDLAGPGDFRPPDRPDEASLVAWYTAGLDHTVATLGGADPAATVWTWAEDRTAGFVQRRMAHEAVVHAWDAAAARHQAWTVDASLAVDGVDELLDAFLFRVAVVDGLGDGIHLHSTDTDDGLGEWLLRTESEAWVVEHRHAKGAFAARAPASGLLLALWGRVPVVELQTFGDSALFQRFTAALAASMGSRRP